MNAMVTLDELSSTYSALADTSAVRAGLLRRAAGFLTDKLFIVLTNLIERVAPVIEGIDVESLYAAQQDAEQAADVHRLITALEDLLVQGRKILEVVEEERLARAPSHLNVLDALRDQMDSLADLLESYHLSQSPEFRAIVNEATRDLRPAEGRRADWRAALASLRD